MYIHFLGNNLQKGEWEGRERKEKGWEQRFHRLIRGVREVSVRTCGVFWFWGVGGVVGEKIGKMRNGKCDGGGYVKGGGRRCCCPIVALSQFYQWKSSCPIKQQR